LFTSTPFSTTTPLTSKPIVLGKKSYLSGDLPPFCNQWDLTAALTSTKISFDFTEGFDLH
jgi:hypothetical protein